MVSESRNKFCVTQQTPTTATWTKISEDYYNKWQFPNCLGAVDGKHVMIQAPPNSGTLYYNYKVIKIVIFIIFTRYYLNPLLIM